MNTEKYLKRVKLNKVNHLLLESMLRYERAVENYRSARRQEEAVHNQYWETLKQQIHELNEQQLDEPRAIAEKKIDLYRRLLERRKAKDAGYASSRAEREKTLMPLEAMVAGAKEEFQNASNTFVNTYAHLKQKGLLSRHDERICGYVVILALSMLEDSARDTMMAMTELTGCADQAIDKIIRRCKEGDGKNLPDPPRSPS